MSLYWRPTKVKPDPSSARKWVSLATRASSRSRSLWIEGEEVQVVGVLQDFPGLVRLRWCQDVGEVVGCGADPEMPVGLDVVFQNWS